MNPNEGAGTVFPVRDNGRCDRLIPYYRTVVLKVGPMTHHISTF